MNCSLKYAYLMVKPFFEINIKKLLLKFLYWLNFTFHYCLPKIQFALQQYCVKGSQGSNLICRSKNESSSRDVKLWDSKKLYYFIEIHSCVHKLTCILYHTYLYTFHKAEAVWTRGNPDFLIDLAIAFKSSVAQNNGLQK